MVAMNLERLVFHGKNREVALSTTDVTGEDDLGMVGHGGGCYSREALPQVANDWLRASV